MRAILPGLLLSSLLISPGLATPADVLAANRVAAAGNGWSANGTLALEFAYAGQGLTGNYHARADLQHGWWADHFEIGPATGANGFNGEHAWMKDISGTVTLQDGGELRALAVNDGYRRANLWWRTDRAGAVIADDGKKSESGNSYDVLTVTPGGGKKFDAWFDAKTHLLFRTVEQQGPQTIVTTYSNYAPINGVEFAGKTLVGDGDTKYDQTLTLKSASFASALPQSAFGPPQVKVADFSIAGGAHQTSIPFALVNNHIFANVSVDGKGPYAFIFDTGGLNIVTPRLAAALGLQSEGKIEGNGAGAGHMQMALTKIANLRLGAAEVNDQLFIVAPLDALDAVEGKDMPGMVGFQTFRRFVTRFDYGAKTVTLIAPGAFDPKTAGVAVPFKFNGNSIEIQASYDGISGNFTVDTGSRASLTLSAPFAARHGLYGGATTVDAITGWGVGGPSRARVLRGHALSFGPETVERPVVEVSTDKAGAMADSSIAGNIGAGILKRYIVTLDYGRQTMYVKPVGTPVEDLDTFDRAGLWFNEAQDGMAVIDVTKGAPADQAGLRAGDVIVAVDGKPATSLKVYEIRKELRDEAPGTVVNFTIRRAGAEKTLAVTLRDLI